MSGPLTAMRSACRTPRHPAIGRRYRRQDEIGTPWCVTVDVDSLEDGAVTVRDRDSMEQQRVPVEGVTRLILDRLDAARTEVG